MYCIIWVVLYSSSVLPEVLGRFERDVYYARHGRNSPVVERTFPHLILFILYVQIITQFRSVPNNRDGYLKHKRAGTNYACVVCIVFHIYKNLELNVLNVMVQKAFN